MTPIFLAKPFIPTHLIGKIGLVGILLFLHACSLFMLSPTTQEPTNHQNFYEQRLIALEAITQWQLQGKISITKNNKNYSGSLSWQHQPDAFQLVMKGPLGQGQLKINGSSDQVTAIVDGDIVIADTLNQLFAEYLGWPLPVNNMQDWVRGIVPKHNLQQATIDAKGHITRVKQSSWQITLANYRAIDSVLPEQTVWLPSKITIVGQDMTLRMIIKQWQP